MSNWRLLIITHPLFHIRLTFENMLFVSVIDLNITVYVDVSIPSLLGTFGSGSVLLNCHVRYIKPHCTIATAANTIIFRWVQDKIYMRTIARRW